MFYRFLVEWWVGYFRHICSIKTKCEVKTYMMQKIICLMFGVLKKLWAAYRQRCLRKQKISQSVDFEANLKVSFKRRKD